MFLPLEVWSDAESGLQVILNLLDGGKPYCQRFTPITTIDTDDISTSVFHERGRDHHYKDLVHARLALPKAWNPICSYAVDSRGRYCGPAAFGYPNKRYSGAWQRTNHHCIGWYATHNYFLEIMCGQDPRGVWPSSADGRWTKEPRGPHAGEYYTCGSSFAIAIFFPDKTAFNFSFSFIYGEDGNAWFDTGSHACAFSFPLGEPDAELIDVLEAYHKGLSISLKDLIMSRANQSTQDQAKNAIMWHYNVLNILSSCVNELWFYWVCVGLFNSHFSRTGRWSKSVLTPVNPPAPQESAIFLFNEPDLIINKLDPYLLGKQAGDMRYFLSSAKQHAFYDAVRNMPRLSDNSVSNLKEIGSTLYNLVVHHHLEVPQSLSSSWLWYRYQYQTSKMDLEEAARYLGRHIQDDLQSRGVRTYGQYYGVFKDTPIIVRCEVIVKSRELDFFSNLAHKLDEYGLSPDFYLVWDSIPFSFMVDWFVPVGDMLSVLDARRTYSEEYYDYQLIGYSISYLSNTDDGMYSVYARWSEARPPELESFYWLESSSVSERTTIMRAIDAYSIFIGGV